MRVILLIFSIIPLLCSCSSENHFPEADDNAQSHVLLLKVDYLTAKFEGGYEFEFSQHSDGFTVVAKQKLVLGKVYLRMEYEELGRTIFEGSIKAYKAGEITFPKNIEAPDMFDRLLTQDYVSPVNGFEVVYNPLNHDFDYLEPWRSVQSIIKVRKYLEANPSQKVKLFLYKPNLSKQYEQDWCWILFLKK